MITETLSIPADSPGTRHDLTVHRFGPGVAGPRVYIQAALHADEIPGMICAQVLRRDLERLELAGEIAGEIVLVPVANPLGLGQTVLGQPIGRFSLADGGNFNRDFPELGPGLWSRVGGSLTDDAPIDVQRLRASLAEELATRAAPNAAAHLKKTLVGLALDADLVFDLHCDGEAAMHLYTHTASVETFAPLAHFLGARAVLFAQVSGGDPFDEALSRPWCELAAALPNASVPFGCQSVTVELRGRADVDWRLAEHDAAAIIAFLRHVGAVGGERPQVPAASCLPTPLEASEPLVAPVGGILVYRREVGSQVAVGDVLAEIVDPLTGETTPVATRSDGVFYARTGARFVAPGGRLGKVAGTVARRFGKLLSP